MYYEGYDVENSAKNGRSISKVFTISSNNEHSEIVTLDTLKPSHGYDRATYKLTVRDLLGGQTFGSFNGEMLLEQNDDIVRPARPDFSDMPIPRYLLRSGKTILPPIKDVEILGTYLGMPTKNQSGEDVAKDIIMREAKKISSYLRVVSAEGSYLIVGPDNSAWGSIRYSSDDIINEISIDAAVLDIEKPQNAPGYNHDQAKKRIKKLFGYDVNPDGSCKNISLKILLEDSCIRFQYATVLSPEVEAMVGIMQKYFANRFPLLDRELFGVKLGESFAEIKDRLDENGIKYEVKLHEVGMSGINDKVGIPKKTIRFDGSLAKTKTGGYSELTFFQDILIKIESYDLKIDLSNIMLQKYGIKDASEYSPKKVFINVDKGQIEILYGGINVAYSYVNADAAEQYFQDLVVKTIKDFNTKKAQTVVKDEF